MFMLEIHEGKIFGETLIRIDKGIVTLIDLFFSIETTSTSSQVTSRSIRGKKPSNRSQGLESVRVVNPIEGPTATATDLQRRDDLQSTYLVSLIFPGHTKEKF